MVITSRKHPFIFWKTDCWGVFDKVSITADSRGQGHRQIYHVVCEDRNDVQTCYIEMNATSARYKTPKVNSWWWWKVLKLARRSYEASGFAPTFISFQHHSIFFKVFTCWKCIHEHSLRKKIWSESVKDKKSTVKQLKPCHLIWFQPQAWGG